MSQFTSAVAVAAQGTTPCDFVTPQTVFSVDPALIISDVIPMVRAQVGFAS